MNGRTGRDPVTAVLAATHVVTTGHGGGAGMLLRQGGKHKVVARTRRSKEMEQGLGRGRGVGSDRAEPERNQNDEMGSWLHRLKVHEWWQKESWHDRQSECG